MTLTKKQEEFVDTIARNTEGLRFLSTGKCPGCEECGEELDPSFSWSACDLCGDRLGGLRVVWHGINDHDEIVHGDNACERCVEYLANGTLPEED